MFGVVHSEKTAGFNLHANALALATAERVGLRDNEILRVSVREKRRAIKAPLKSIATKDFAPPERTLVRPSRFRSLNFVHLPAMFFEQIMKVVLVLPCAL